MDRDKYLNGFLDKVKKEVAEPNRNYILDYLSLCKAQGTGSGRGLEQARYLYRVAIANPKDFKQWDEKDVTAAINTFLESKWYFKIRGKKTFRVERPYSQNTILAMKVVLKGFFKWLYGNNGCPDCVRSVKCKAVRGVKVTERDVLTLAEVKALVDASTTPRDKAFIWCLYESGGRRGELHKMTRKDVEFDENGAIITLHTEKTENREGLTIPVRKVRVNYGAYDLAMWLNSMSDVGDTQN